jgi:hypothetical protein
MESLLLIVLVGIGLALAAALLVIRRRDGDLDALVARGAAASCINPLAPADGDAGA